MDNDIWHVVDFEAWRKWEGCETPEYTASLDAALALVPEGTDRWAVWRGMRGSCASVEHDKPHMWAAHAGRAATPALALTAAALRARMGDAT